MLEFRIGDRVTFQPEGRQAMTGMLTRYNKKTVTIVTDAGERWNVAPGFLRRADTPQETEVRDVNVIPMHKK